jgi:hypothetical protein
MTSDSESKTPRVPLAEYNQLVYLHYAGISQLLAWKPTCEVAKSYAGILLAPHKAVLA